LTSIHYRAFFGAMRSSPLRSAFAMTFGAVLSIGLPEIAVDPTGEAARLAKYTSFLGDDVPQGIRIPPRLEHQP
jgi:hypothetical protein